jgi:hypothetical protein
MDYLGITHRSPMDHGMTSAGSPQDVRIALLSGGKNGVFDFLMPQRSIERLCITVILNLIAGENRNRRDDFNIPAIPLIVVFIVFNDYALTIQARLTINLPVQSPLLNS